jgi:CRISPR-associated protein Csm4
MAYSVFKLEFSTGLHLGQAVGGPSLDDGKMTVNSDTLFSALAWEAVKRGKLPELVEYFRENILAVSDALPYQNEELYLPKPVFYPGKQRQGDPALRKKFKSIEFIPLSFFHEFLMSLKGCSMCLEKLSNEFGRMMVETKVALSGQDKPQPFHVAIWRFNKDCGLYIIVWASENEALTFLTDLLIDLGLSGIGGKLSAGLGKFTVQEISVPQQLVSLLENSKASFQMLLGTGLPDDANLESVLNEGWYTIIRRGGYVRSENYAQRQLKKRTIYMLAAGSCLKKRFIGGMFDLSDEGAHPVWRCGNTLFAGVDL